MTQTPLISIITPLYNAQAYIEATMQSVRSQTYTHWEWWIVDDSSQDQGPHIVEQYSHIDPRIHLVTLPENGGAAVARNVGLDRAQGDYVAFIDSDDRWLPDKLAKQLAFMQAHHYTFTYTDLALVDSKGHLIKDQVGVPESLSYHELLKNTAIACSTVMIDVSQVGSFHMPLVRKGQDTATWLMLMRERQIKAYGLSEVLNHYRQVPGSISSNRWRALKRTWYTYTQLEHLPLWKAAYYFTNYVFNAIRRRL